MSNAVNTLLEVKNLKKYFATKAGPLCAVDDVSFDVARGETLGLVGESGCGKSTTGRAILRLHEPTAGQVIFEGQDIVGYNKAQMKAMRKEMQIVFQDPYSCLNPRMDVKSLIEDSLKVSGNGESRAEREEKVYEAMNLVGLEKRLATSYPHELDGGRRQRIGIARALILQPKFIVMDEPVSALDVCVQAQILNLMLELQEKMGLTYLFISHNLSVVKHVSNKIAVMYLGKIMEVASYRDIFLEPHHPLHQGSAFCHPHSQGAPQPGADHSGGRHHQPRESSCRLPLCQPLLEVQGDLQAAEPGAAQGWQFRCGLPLRGRRLNSIQLSGGAHLYEKRRGCTGLSGPDAGNQPSHLHGRGDDVGYPGESASQRGGVPQRADGVSLRPEV